MCLEHASPSNVEACIKQRCARNGGLAQVSRFYGQGVSSSPLSMTTMSGSSGTLGGGGGLAQTARGSLDPNCYNICLEYYFDERACVEMCTQYWGLAQIGSQWKGLDDVGGKQNGMKPWASLSWLIKSATVAAWSYWRFSNLKIKSL